MVGGDGFLLLFVTNVIGLRGDEVDELGAAVEHQLPGVVGHTDVGNDFFDHFVQRCSRNTQLIIRFLLPVRHHDQNTSTSWLDSSLLVSLGLWFQYERILGVGLSTGALSLLCSTLKRQLLCTVQLPSTINDHSSDFLRPCKFGEAMRQVFRIASKQIRLSFPANT